MRFACFLVVILAGSTTAFAAPESWADQKLPVRDGLLLWLDGNAINAGRAAKQLPLFANGAVIDHWPDASGAQRDLTQPVDQSRPRFQVTPGSSFVRFDGRDDYLTGTNIKAALARSTLCIVARPRANPGKFRAFVSANATGDNDYTSGFNIDMGGAPSTTLKVLNAEGAGFSGERDLLTANVPLGAYHIIIAQLDQAPGGVHLFLDGAAQGARERASQPLRIDRLTIGARHCAADEKLPFIQGFLDGDIAELLLFDRVISEGERNTLASYLGEKHAALLAGRFHDQSDRPLLPVKDPPLVQMLVPGFSVGQLPVALTNINCLRYRADGRLVAGGYNGKIWLLSDANGDGLEETADLYWESDQLKHVIGMAVTPPDDPRGDGLFVATAGRILFIPDANRDGRGDKEVIVATGWEKQASPGGGGSVDALGLALGPDGSIYFALGTSAYNNAYLLDKDGRSHYQLGSERGTILRATPDFARREIICTGIRYPYGAAFNRFGDLFVTEQEGATWLPNGNPFDELLHIERGKHYGFPPRHPRHLPNVIDEPSTFDYRPQHQSTCGLVFNGAPGSRAVFGPASWADDVFVAGESRGKIWRTKLVRTAPGYVARTDLIACLAMLTVDLAISPSGNLVVACHSGAPDWGTGPEGAGKIFQIRFRKADTPQPVAAWCNSPQEIRIAFDQPLDPARLRNLAKEVEITRGHHVAAGDRFETIRPGYQVVKTQLAVPRWPVPVETVSLTPDRTTLILATPRLTAAEEYAIQIPDRLSTLTGARDGLPQHNTLDLATNLTGLEAIWKSADGSETLQTWLPHLDFAVARALTAGSSEHNRLWQCLQRSGTLTLRGQLNLWQMLQPPIQPGSQLDYTRPPEKVRVEISTKPPLAKFPVTLEHEAREGQWTPFELTFPTKTDAAPPAIAATWSTADDPRPRPFPVGRFLLPWARATPERGADPAERTMRELVGGNWSRGRGLYFGKSTCHVCHAIRGTGGAIGPDLSNLIHRDLTTVLRDIRDPSAALNPDHLAYHVVYKDGTESVAALLGEEAENLRLGDASGALKTVPRSDLRAMQPLTASLMPAGLLDALTATEQRDLLTFLLKPTLEPAPIEAPNPPPPRSRAEVDRILGRLAAPSTPDKTLRVLLAFGPKDHGPGEHNYPLWAQRWAKLLALAEKVEISAHSGWPSPAHFSSHDVIVFYSNNPGWNAQRKPELDDFIHRGGGVVFIHWAVEGRDDAPALADCIGLASNSRTTKYRHGPLQLTFPKPDHPIIRGLDGLTLLDESYWQLVGDPRAVEILGEQIEDGAPRPQLWASERGAGRLFVSIPGHYTWSFDDPLFRLLLLRGICWSAKQPVDRLSELATIGARMSETR